MEYLRTKGQLPQGVKSFEETYPSLSKAQLEKIQKEREEQEALEAEARRREKTPAELVIEKREARKVAGGRYALR